jgi:thymidylate synthase (FAD)
MIEVTYIDHMGSDLSVVNAARVSFGKKGEWEFECDCVTDPSCMEIGCDCGNPHFARQLFDRDTKLIKYLAKHGHYSPFGHAFASFHIKAPIFVARQLVKHKFLRWNEVSRRYVDDLPEIYHPEKWRGRSADKKQGSEGFITQMETRSDQTVDHFYRIQCINALDVYHDAIATGVCPEQARMILPQSTMTEWYWSGSLDAFIDMCNLRCKPDTQYETRLVADYVRSEMIKLFPVSVEALVK